MVTATETPATTRDMKPRSRVEALTRLRAPFSLRCGAILIDYIVLIAIVALSTLISRLLGGGARTAGTSTETIGLLLAVVAAVLNLGVLPGLTGMTIGKWATGLRVIRSSGGDMGMGRAFLRHFVGYPVSLFTFGIGFLIAALNARGRSLHDLIADTIVIRDVPRSVRAPVRR